MNSPPSDPLGRLPEHLAEVAEILALGLQRLQARKSSGLSAQGGESSLGFVANQSGHATGGGSHGR